MSEALIGLISGIVGAIIGALGTGLTLKYNYKHLYADVVSKSRDKWLNEMREHISILLASKRQSISKNRGSLNTDYAFEYRKARDQIILRLNEKEKLHQELKEEILELDVCKTIKKFEEIEINILNTCRPLLKIEWDRVRSEARGENWF